METAATECVTALQALYSSPDQATQKQADAWLVKFQQSTAAWQVCDQILTNSEQVPLQFRFFAAQTMRTKVQFDFYELPADAYGNLRETLLNHVDKFRSPEFQPVLTQLAMAVADLAIQMDSAWPDVVDSLFQRFGNNPESFASLLEVLRMLPEENQNYKLLTDSAKRYNTRERFSMGAPKVIQFLLSVQCPNVMAKKKVLECFLSWIKFTNLSPQEMAQNPMLPESFKFVSEGGELSETATDIIVEILRMSNGNYQYFQPVIQVIFSLLPALYKKFEMTLQQGPDRAVEVDSDGMQQICRIYVETAECCLPLIMEQSTNPEVLTVLKVICQCSDLPVQEISSITLEFWQRLSYEVCRHPEMDVKINQFQAIYMELLGVAVRRCTMPSNQDPFQADDDVIDYRKRLLSLASSCVDVVTPNTALEHVLQSLASECKRGIQHQEAHFYVLTVIVGDRVTEVQETSVLWDLIKSLPPLIMQTIEQDTTEAALLKFTKKTAIELLGSCQSWVKTRPDFLRSALEMISVLLLSQTPAGAPAHLLEQTKQVQQSAAMAFKEIAVGGRMKLQELVGSLVQLYVQTMALPIRMHLFIVEGVIEVVVQQTSQPEAFKSSLEQLMTPLVAGLSSELDKPNVLAEILDRVTTIVTTIKVKEGTATRIIVGALITNTLWPGVQTTLKAHPGDAKVVEKSIRVVKHSMRCAPELFKPNVSALVSTLIANFQQYQHSSYLYSAEILANTYASDPEIVPALTHLFNQLSSIGLTVLMAAKEANELENITELVEDFYGMYERYLRFAPMIVLEAPTLPPTLQMWLAVIFVQQRDAVEAIIAFILQVLEHIAEAVKVNNNSRYADARKAQYGALLRNHVIQIMPPFIEAIFRLIVGVPTDHAKKDIPNILYSCHQAFPVEFPQWLEAGFQHLPASVASQAERQKLGEQLVSTNQDLMEDAVHELCYRCEQVALRNRASTGSTTNQK